MTEATMPARDRARRSWAYLLTLLERYDGDQVLRVLDELGGEESAHVAFGLESAKEAVRDYVLPRLQRKEKS